MKLTPAEYQTIIMALEHSAEVHEAAADTIDRAARNRGRATAADARSTYAANDHAMIAKQRRQLAIRIAREA